MATTAHANVLPDFKMCVLLGSIMPKLDGSGTDVQSSLCLLRSIMGITEAVRQFAEAVR